MTDTEPTEGSGPELVVLGNLIVDDIVYEDGRTRMQQAGGAVVHFALGANLWGCSVGVSSVVGDNYPVDVLDKLAERGIDLGGVKHVDGPGMRTWLLYEGSGRRVVHRLRSPNHDDMSPAVGTLPESWTPSAIHLAPMPLHRQRELLDHFRKTTNALLSVDPYTLIDESTWDACMAAFTAADILLASVDEILLDSGVDQRERWFNSGIPRVFFKQGSTGGTVFDNNNRSVSSWDGRANNVVDPTGAGDAFAGGLLAGLSRGDSVEEALKLAVVSAGLTLECGSVEAMFDVDASDAQRRYKEWFG